MAPALAACRVCALPGTQRRSTSAPIYLQRVCIISQLRSIQVQHALAGVRHRRIYVFNAAQAVGAKLAHQQCYGGLKGSRGSCGCGCGTLASGA